MLNPAGSPYSPRSPLGLLMSLHSKVEPLGPDFEDEQRMCGTQLAAALDIYWRSHCHASACGFKVFDEHLRCGGNSSDAGRSQIARVFARQQELPIDCRIRVIILERRNKSAAHASLLYSLRSRDWHSTPEAIATRKAMPAINCSHCDESYTKQLRMYTSFTRYKADASGYFEWAQGLARHYGSPILNVAMEGLFMTNASWGLRGSRTKELNCSEVNRIALFLNAEPILTPKTLSMRRMRSRPYWDIVGSYPHPTQLMWDAFNPLNPLGTTARRGYKQAQRQERNAHDAGAGASKVNNACTWENSCCKRHPNSKHCKDLRNQAIAAERMQFSQERERGLRPCPLTNRTWMQRMQCIWKLLARGHGNVLPEGPLQIQPHSPPSAAPPLYALQVPSPPRAPPHVRHTRRQAAAAAAKANHLAAKANHLAKLTKYYKHRPRRQYSHSKVSTSSSLTIATASGKRGNHL